MDLKVTLVTNVELLLISEQIVLIIVPSTIICRPHTLVHDIVVLFDRKILLRLMLPIIVIASIDLVEMRVLHCKQVGMILFLNFCSCSSDAC